MYQNSSSRLVARQKTWGKAGSDSRTSRPIRFQAGARRRRSPYNRPAPIDPSSQSQSQTKLPNFSAPLCLIHGHQEGKNQRQRQLRGHGGGDSSHGGSHNEPPPPPPRPLPPGVYFSPTREECLGFLNRWIAGDNEMPDARGHVSVADVYGEGPDTLCRRHPPASVRGPGEHAWWFLSQTRFQSHAAGGGASKRADRSVEPVGFWRLENGKNQLEALDGVQNSFGFYVGRSKNKKQDKTPWLMQEFTSGQDDGAGKPGVRALYRVYLTPHATDEQRRHIFGEEGVRFWPNGRKKPVRAMVPEECFDGIAGLLPPGSVRGGVGQEHVHAPPPPPPVAPPEGLLDYYNGQQQGQHVDQYHQQQQEQYLGQYERQDQYLYQYEQAGPFSAVAPPLPPPASPGLLGEFATDDKGEEPNWEALEDIVDDDEFANFNKEG